MKPTFTFILLLFISLHVFSQQITIKGTITDEHNQAIPFASVYIKNTTRGTSANSEGEYTMQVKPGTYDVQYKAVGYKQESRKLNLTGSVVLNVVLTTETYQLKGVVISSGEDP